MSLELRLWEFGKDDGKIDSFLTSASIAHNDPKKTVEWFHWKFEQSPYGKAILACAFDGDIVAGCVAMGKGMLKYKNKRVKYALSYETFVNPNYQGHGLFKKLINLVNEECIKQGIELIYNFPNKNSLTGFLRLGYKQVENHSCYLIKPTKLISFLKNIRDLKKSFVPNKSNLESIKETSIPNIKEQDTNDILSPHWSKKYLEWRFLTFPVGDYWFYIKDGVFGIVRKGMRGNLVEAQILFVTRYTSDSLDKHDIRKFENAIKKCISPHFLSYDISKKNPIHKLVRSHTFIAPTRSNFTYKILNDSNDFMPFAISLNRIDAHTY